MNFLNRIWNLIRGKTDVILTNLENPTEQLSVIVSDLNNQLKLQHQSVAKAMADEKKLKMDLEELINLTHEWEKKAVFALQQNDEQLARQALIRKEDTHQKAIHLEKIWIQQKEETDKLRQSFQGAKERVEDAKRQYTLLVAQYESAKAKKQISQSASLMSNNSSLNGIEKLKEKIRLLEAETEAENLLSNSGSQDELDKKFRDLDSKMKTDQALDLLKEKMNSNKKLNSSTDKLPTDLNARDVTPEKFKKVGGQ